MRPDAEDVLRAYVRERHRHLQARALPISPDRVQASPQQESEWWVSLSGLMVGVPAMAIEVYHLRVVGHGGHAIDPRDGLRSALPLSDQSIAGLLGIRRSEVTRLAAQARRVVGDRMAERRRKE